MQRVRMSLPYFKDFDWKAEVVTIDPQFADIVKDELLLQSIPSDIKIHTVKALSKKWTSKMGLGSIALRSLWFYKQKVNRIVKEQKFDLIYFSTTQFPVLTLGAYWKKRFNIPYVIDMQDPWHSDYYRDKPKEQQPPKYWLSYRLNKYLEPIAMKQVGGLISVSANYIEDLKNRYPQIKHVPEAVITFGAFDPDTGIADDNKNIFKPLLNPEFKNIVYVGRGGIDMHKAIVPVFQALQKALKDQPEVFNKIKLYFIGTSYAAAGKGVATILPLAKKYNVENNVIELTDRISYYHTLVILQQADALFVPGSDDPKYSASKIYPYLLMKKPLLTIFNKNSSAIKILQEYGVKHNYSYNLQGLDQYILQFFTTVIEGNNMVDYNPAAFEKYSAKKMAQRQTELFDKTINGEN
ncbi:hypothetical protein ACPPVU_11940 [Mucilaginibacter sp. McL0603]|uniref:hypothetical protein n=1 Tax=Mucilaginibacter sp. McL0603 TaxID=3415670 RepID=UPI003CF8AE65